MKRKRLDPFSQEVTDRIVAHIKSMTPQERHDFLTYRTPGVPLSDMTGMFGMYEEEDAKRASEKNAEPKPEEAAKIPEAA